MLQNKRIKMATGFLFITAEATLWLLIQLSIGPVIALEYSSVLLACLFTALFARRSADYVCIQTGLIFTALADFFLVVSDPARQIPAMLFFSVTQLAYATMLYLDAKDIKSKRIHIVLRLLLTIALEVGMLAVLGSSADLLTAITMFYFANLLSNAIFAFAAKERLLFALGLVFFICCDVFVGMEVLISDYISISEDSLIYKLTNLGINTAWLFYIPSQVLISLSVAYSGGQPDRRRNSDK